MISAILRTMFLRSLLTIGEGDQYLLSTNYSAINRLSTFLSHAQNSNVIIYIAWTSVPGVPQRSNMLVEGLDIGSALDILARRAF